MTMVGEDERKIILKKSDLVNLAQEIYRIFGTGSGIILSYIGLGIGKSIAGNTVSENRSDIINIFREVFSERGFGKVNVELSDSPGFSGRISFSELPFSNEDPLHEVCEMLVKGIFQGFVNKAFEVNKIIFTKEQCVAKGNDACVFSFNLKEK
ncbi:MAG: hypothetical protein ACUVQ0_03970 [Thermoproteota archaeon]